MIFAIDPARPYCAALLRNTQPVHLRLKAIVPGQYPGLAEATIDRQFTSFQGWG